jgi:hypothetical protein
MNPKIEVFHLGTSIFKGKMLTLPFKKDIISARGQSLFGDDDPCAIQESQIRRTLVKEMLSVFDDELTGQRHIEMMQWLDFDHPEDLVIRKR